MEYIERLLPTIQDRSVDGFESLLPIELGNRELVIPIPKGQVPIFRQALRREARDIERLAKRAHNKARLANILGGGIGGTIATTGIVTLATMSGPMTIAGAIVTGIGVCLAGFGSWAGFRLGNIAIDYEHVAESHRDKISEL